MKGGGRFDGEEGWSLEPRVCDSCKSSPATLFCRADSAFLCLGCDRRVHGANRLASRHERVWLCEVCEQAPAFVTCNADAAALCITCDRDIHSANPLAQRHERVPVVPFHNPVPATGKMSDNSARGILVPSVDPDGLLDGTDSKKEDNVDEKENSRADEAEAVSWLLPNSKMCNQEGELKCGDYFFREVDPYLDLDHSLSNDYRFHQNNSSDSVVPVHNKLSPQAIASNNSITGSDTDYYRSKARLGFCTVPLSHSNSISSSSLDVGVVPDGSSLTDISNPYCRSMNDSRGTDLFPPTQLVSHYSPLDREARVLRYREKRKNRKFEKTIRYASRKAYAETRPRIKGRFVKRTEIEGEVDRIYSAAGVFMADSGYGLVPSFKIIKSRTINEKEEVSVLIFYFPFLKLCKTARKLLS